MKSNNLFSKYIRPIIVLICICFVITAALALTYGITNPIIAQRAQADADQARQELLAEADAFTLQEGELFKTDDGKVEVTEVYAANNGAGYVVTVQTKSFGGPITEMVGVSKDGVITGVKVTAHTDTPGVGTKAQTVEHLAQYNGLNELVSTTAKDEQTVDAVSGATVTSNAVHYGVYGALEQLKSMGGDL